MYLNQGWEKVRRFEPSFVRCTFKTKFLPSKLRCHAHFNVCTCALLQSKRMVNNVGVFQESEAASVSFLSPAMLNPSRNSDRNKTSTRYKAIIKFWRLSIAIQGKSNIDKNTCEPSNFRSFLLTKLRKLFPNLHPSPNLKSLVPSHIQYARSVWRLSWLCCSSTCSNESK